MSAHDMDDAVLVCCRVADMPPFAAVSASVRTFCHKCGHSVWIAPTSVEFVAKHPLLRLLCNQCFTIEAATDTEPTQFMVVPGAFQELVDSGADPEVIAFMRYVEMMQGVI